MVLRIESMTSEARGVAHENGRTVFVSGVLPGETAECRITAERSSCAFAEAERIIEPSPLRIAPSCPYYGRCGGCDFQIVSSRDSAAIKKEVVRESLKRIGKRTDVPDDIPVFWGDFNGYRHRARFHVDCSSRRWGFLGRSSSSLVPIGSCPALSPRLDAMLSDSRALLNAGRAAMFSGRVNRETGYAEISAFEGDDDVSLDSRAVPITVGGIRYMVSGSVFFQSNPSLLPALLDFVRENTVGETVMDLYSGVGTFSALFEGSGRRVYAVERNRECLALSRVNAPSALSFTADVAAWGRKSGRCVDTVIVDPPRTGLSSEALSLILSWKPGRIIYVSCDSATLSRDAGHMKGYAISKAAVFDFYPGTGHDESALVLDRE